MKYLKLYESFSKKKIHEICKEYGIKNYTINSDGSIDVYDQFISLYNKKLEKIPLQFNKVYQSFSCSCNNLISFEGSPKEVNGYFICQNNKLTSFQYAPRIIRAWFDCQNNNIKTFEYFPSYISGAFQCDYNPIYEVWRLFHDWTKIELLNDYDIFRDEDTDEPAIIMDRLNDFLLEIGGQPVEEVKEYKNI